MKRLLALITLSLLVLPQAGWGQGPQTISYQGVLRDANGNVVANDDYDIRFNFYDVNDNEVWSEWHSVAPAGNPVTVTDGVFSVILGKETPFTTITETPFWLGIKIGAGAELPRIELTSVIYALHADRSDSSNYAQKAGEVSGTGNVFPSSGFVGIGTTNPENALHVKGWFKLESGDFFMGPDPDRGDGGRALVHQGTGSGTDDMLVLNFGGDFEEGVLVDGSRLEVAGNLIANSYVGIGTATPAYPLDVQADVTGDFVASITNTGTGASGGKGLLVSLADTGAAGAGDIFVVERSGNPFFKVTKQGNVGIGAATPAAKLEVEDGTVLFEGSTGGTPVSGGGTRLMWIPSKAAFRAGSVSGTQWDDASIGDFSAVGGGKNNIASSQYATVSGGYNNTASFTYATVGGGYGNNASNQYATVGGGQSNTASYSWATIGGGNSNTAGYLYATVGGGFGNTASIGNYATVGGGGSNIASGQSATVSGGYSNSASNQYATVGGGRSNSASNQYATVSGGHTNIASGLATAVPGGRYNAARGDYSFAAGFNARANHIGAVVIAACGSGSSIDSVASGGVEQMVLRADGGLYITNSLGTAPYYASRLINTSSAAYLSTAGKWYAIDFVITSDVRWKKNVRTLSDALDKAMRLRGVSFEWRADARKNGELPKGTQVGFIAQEVERVLPEVVHTDSDGYKSVSYANLTALLVEAMKELHAEKEALEQHVTAQQGEITELQQKMARVEALLESADLASRD